MIQNVSQDTVGVVLAVNGKNTLFQEDLTSKPVAECTKWVLAPGESYTVEGFYMSEDGKDVRAFKVLSDDASAKADLSPESKGVFSMVVFRSAAAGPDAVALNVSGDAGDLSRSPKQKGKARNLLEAQTALRSVTHTHVSKGQLVADHAAVHPAHVARRATQKGGRGLVVDDTTSSAGSNLNRVGAQLDPSPSISLFIRYYTAPGAAASN